ncbi:hypothetical protein EXN66_Car007569 [Channa argus]|uniref:Uncharacterized protein n=1 Tax=Channa argus TaxID=215402 RepID=A0A6G1PP23_CHAAH|nr:hypothetical protein EXN66_Car007569 [Channa argus]
MDPAAIVLLSLTRLSGPGDTLLTFTKIPLPCHPIPPLPSSFFSFFYFSLSYASIKSLTLFLSLHLSIWQNVKGWMEVWMCVCERELE